MHVQGKAHFVSLPKPGKVCLYMCTMQMQKMHAGLVGQSPLARDTTESAGDKCKENTEESQGIIDTPHAGYGMVGMQSSMQGQAQGA